MRRPWNLLLRLSLITYRVRRPFKSMGVFYEKDTIVTEEQSLNIKLFKTKVKERKLVVIKEETSQTDLIKVLQDAQEKLEAEKLEAEKLEAEKLEAEKLEAEKLEAEKLEAEKLEAKKLEAKKLEAEAKAVSSSNDGTTPAVQVIVKSSVQAGAKSKAEDKI